MEFRRVLFRSQLHPPAHSIGLFGPASTLSGWRTGYRWHSSDETYLAGFGLGGHSGRRGIQRSPDMDSAHLARTRLRGQPAGFSNNEANVGQRSTSQRLGQHRSEEHTSELQSLMRISYA